MNQPTAEPTPAQTNQPDAMEEADQTLRKLMPWVVSLLLHAGFVIVAMMLVWVTFEPAEEERLPVKMHLQNTPDAPVQAEQMAEAKSEDDASPTQSNVQSPDLPTPTISDVNYNLIGPNLPMPSPQTEGNPMGDGKDKGPGGGEILPPVQLNRIVYVIDASGSLIDSFPFIMNELREAIGEMGTARTQTGRPYEFAVVFFRDGQVVELGGPGTGLDRGFNPATPDRVAHAIAALSPGGSRIGPGGKTDPLPAILQALRYKPQQLVLLSDNITGQGIHALDPDALIDAVLDARGNQRIRFDTVQFLYPDPMVEIGRTATLSRLARETGGTYRFVSERQLGLR